MLPEDPFDAAHMRGAASVEEFLAALLDAREVAPGEARRHADNAFVFVEYLANTFPKVPEQAHERDTWVFLFDYYICQGPFEGPAVADAPRSLRLFFEYLAHRRRLDEIAYLRHACEQAAFYSQRAEGWARIERAASDGRGSGDDVEAMVAAWQDELAARMRPRGLVPDAALARGEGPWLAEMGPVEAAVFDAVCVVLAIGAREMERRGTKPQDRETRMLAAQDTFMRAMNPGLGASPLDAILQERAGREWTH